MSVKLIGAIVLSVFALIAKFMPYKAPSSKLTKDMATLGKEYQKWEYLALAVLFVIVPLMTLGLGLAFRWLIGLGNHHNPAIIYQALPDSSHYYGAGMLMSLGLVGIPMELLYRALLKERYAEYTMFTNMKHGFDGWKVFRPMAWTICLATTLFLVLLSDYYVEIHSNQIKMNDLFSLKEKVYDFNEISGVHFVEHVKTKKGLRIEPHYLVSFKNGDYWNTNSGVNKEEQSVAIMKFLSEKSRLPIDTLSYDPE